MTDTATPDTGTAEDTTTDDATATDAGDTPTVETLQAELDKWKAQARKHEDRAKTNATAAKELDTLRKSTMTELEKAVDEAKQEGFTAGRAEGLGRLVSAEIKAAAAGRLAPEALGVLVAGLNLASFLDDDGEVDDQKVTAFVDSIAPAPDTKADPFAGLDLGQGARKRGDDPMALNGDPLLKAVTDRLKH